MSAKDTVTEYLESEPKFRERVNKDKGIANLLIRKYGKIALLVKRDELDRNTIVAMLQDYATMDRVWRQALERRPELRGSDYEEKEKLEVAKQKELGYRVKGEPA